MRSSFLLAICLLFFTACGNKAAIKPGDSTIISMQVIDRNGLNETISSKERLELYQKIDFTTPQPYKKILRVFGKNPEGKNPSKITSYHSNGQLWQYLEALDGRAHGTYREWYPNGVLRIEATVIEGVADINEVAQSSYLFDGVAKVYREEGSLQASISYEKGLLHGLSTYYFENGAIEKRAFYENNLLHGEYEEYDKNASLSEKSYYQMGKKTGLSYGYFTPERLCFKEEYQDGKLLSGLYYNETGELIAEVKEGFGNQLLFEKGKLLAKAEIKEGMVQGKVEFFSKEGDVEKFYTVKENKKTGEEVLYYPRKGEAPKPKISMQWHEDILHGVVKTWYESGSIESQRELCNNKKNGLGFAWYETGEIMLMEEYENDLLLKGTYYKKGEKLPISKIEEGKGIATLYDKNGIFLKKITYEKGKPLLDGP